MLPPTPSADSATLPMNLPMASLRNVLTEGHATRIQRISAQARTSENRMSVLLIRRFRVRSPDAPLGVIWTFVADQDQHRGSLPMRKSAT